MENDTEIHYTWKVAEKGFKMASIMNKLQLLILVKLFLKNKIIFLPKNHCEIYVRTILICPLYLIKYSIQHQSKVCIHKIDGMKLC
jgi:hypothetical protein